MEAYHIDRTARIKQGVINALDAEGRNEKAIQLLRHPQSPLKIVEDIFEKCRKEHYPSGVSRLKSLYATERFSVNRWVEKLGVIQNGLVNALTNVCTIEVDGDYPVYDSVWFDLCWNSEKKLLGESIICRHAHCYWSAAQTENPLIELLCPFPAEVIRLTTIGNFDIETEKMYHKYMNCSKAPEQR